MVKWRGEKSKQLPTNDSGPQGGYIENLEYIAQKITSANCVANDSKLLFVDDLTVL